MLPDIQMDDRGIIVNVKKVGNTFECVNYLNSKPHITKQLLPTGEVINIR